ncbi:MAG: hypothetical protein KC416_06865 [Myxococcales bacterium]|nr:hypothetical protein [Myxococcales bacterium]
MTLSNRLRTIALALGCIMLLGAGGFVFLFGTQAGRRIVSRSIADVLQGEIPGRVSIEELSFDGLQSSHINTLTFDSPDGKQVITLNDVTLDLDFSSLLGGKIHIDSAQVGSGTVTVEVREDGYTELEMAFSDPNSTGKPANLDLRNIRFSDLKLVIRFGPEDSVVAKNLEGFTRITNDPDNPGVVVRLDRVQGVHVKPEMAGMTFALSDVEGRVRGARSKVLVLRGDMESDSNQLRFDVQYSHDKTPKVIAKLDAVDTTPAFDLLARGADALVLPDDVELEFE